jgi:hypothetical protein
MITLEAIHRAYPNAVSATEDNGTFTAFDADGNQITLDQALVDAAAIEVAAEQALSSLRRQRDQLLAETDWVTLKAIDLSNDGLGIQLPQVWMDYRQALRDLPANTVDPANPVWPVKPGA